MKFTEPLKKSPDFRHVYNRGRSKADGNLVLYVLENGTGFNRLGISVSKKVGNSVVRHRIKRLVKEIYRLHETTFRLGYDLVVIARDKAKGQSYQNLEKSICDLARRQGILVEDLAHATNRNNEETADRTDQIL